MKIFELIKNLQRTESIPSIVTPPYLRIKGAWLLSSKPCFAGYLITPYQGPLVSDNSNQCLVQSALISLKKNLLLGMLLIPLGKDTRSTDAV